MNRFNLLTVSSVALLLASTLVAAPAENKANQFWNNEAPSKKTAEPDLGVGGSLELGGDTGSYVIPIRRSPDIDGSGRVEFDDFLQILWHWGPCGAQSTSESYSKDACDADINDDGMVGFDDMLVILHLLG